MGRILSSTESTGIWILLSGLFLIKALVCASEQEAGIYVWYAGKKEQDIGMKQSQAGVSALPFNSHMTLGNSLDLNFLLCKMRQMIPHPQSMGE